MPNPKLTNPFPGLRPFKAEESALFFGRSNHINEILRKLDLFRFVSVVGNSGCGKSSIIRAGVLPRIESQENWRILKMQPGVTPDRSLAKSIASTFGGSEEEILATVQKGPLGFVQSIRSLSSRGDRILLLVDQFEELFRFEDPDAIETQDLFVRSLLESTQQDDVAIHVIITLRSDFLGDCEQFIGLPEAINNGQFLVPRMEESELTECITGPITSAGGKISPRLVQRLVKEVGNKPDQLPVLQHALMLTWNVWAEQGQTDQPIDLEHYEATGAVKSALSKHADSVFQELNGAQQYIASVLFKTITVQGADNRGVRRPTSLTRLMKIANCDKSELITIVDLFRKAENGFIMPPYDVPLSEETMVDISHESLMRIWTRLRTWVEQEARSAGLYQRICENALLYEQGEASLWRDPDLRIALNWIENENPTKDWAVQYNEDFDVALRFIHSSREQEAFILSDRKRSLRIRNTVVLIVLVVLLMLSTWAIFERDNAQSSAVIARNEKGIAEEQRQLAQKNLAKAVNQEERANAHREDAEQQRNLAELKAEEAQASSILAIQASQRSEEARLQAEELKRKAVLQTAIAERLRQKADSANKRSFDLRMLALAQNLAIQSKLTLSQNKDLKSNLALHAHNLHFSHGGEMMDKQIYEALFQAFRSVQPNELQGHKSHKEAIQSLCFQADGKLLSAGSDGMVVSYDREGKSTSTPPISVPFSHVRSSQNQIAALDKDGMMHLFSSKDLTPVQRAWSTGHSNTIVGFFWHNQELITLSLDRTIKFWNPSGKIKRTISIAFSPNASVLASGDLYIGSSTGEVFRLSNGQSDVEQIGKFTTERITTLAVDKDNIAIGTAQGNCILALSGKSPSTLAHPAQLSSVLLLNDATRLVTSCLDGIVRIYRLDGQIAEPILLNEHRSWVMDLAVDPTLRLLASCSKDDKSVRVYPLDEAQMISYLKEHTTRELNQEEWNRYLGEDLEKRALLSQLP